MSTQLQAGAERLCGGHTTRLFSSWKKMLSQCWPSTTLLDILTLTPGGLLVRVVRAMPCSQVESYIPGKWMAWCSAPASHQQTVSIIISEFSFQPSYLQMRRIYPRFSLLPQTMTCCLLERGSYTLWVLVYFKACHRTASHSTGGGGVVWFDWLIN